MVTRGPSHVRVSGPLAPYADGFRAALDAWRFSPWSQMFYLHLLADVSRWLDRHGLGPSGLTDANDDLATVERLRAGDEAAFIRLVDRLSRVHPDVALLCTGPWPPYSFVR